MISALKRLDQKIIFLFAGRVIQAVLTVVTIRLMTEFLKADEIGYQYIINSIFMWFNLVLINPMSMFISRHLNDWKNEKQLHSVLKKMNLYFFLVALVSIPIVFVAKNYFSVLYAQSMIEVLILVFFLIYIGTWFIILASFFNLFEFQRTFVFLTVVSQVAGLIFAYLMITYIRADAIGWLSGILTGQLLGLVLGLILFYRFIPKDTLPSQPQELLFTKAAFLFGYPVAITTLFMWFLNQGYRFVIEQNMGADTLAGVAVGLGLATSTVGVIELITTQYFYPKYYAKLPGSTVETRRHEWEGLWKKTVSIYILGAAAILAVSHLVIKVLVAQEFQYIVPYLMIGIGIEFLKLNSNIAYLVAHGEKKTTKTIAPYLCGAAFLAVSFVVLKNSLYFEMKYILIALMTAHFITYVVNMIQVKRMIQPSFDKVVVLRALLVALPLLLVFAFVQNTQVNLLMQFVLAVVSGLWCLSSIYYLVKKLEATK